jgi:hypothetical protein
MVRNLLAVLGIATLLGGCGASLGNVSTGSLFGGAAKVPAPPPNDPTARAMQVGTTSARALKCGYNFDPTKLRTQFLSTEAATNPAEGTRLAQIYDTSFRGVSNAVAGQGESYCTTSKTGAIKQALNRHLAGDFTPSPPEPVEEEAGIFGDLGDTSGSGKDTSFKHPVDDLH